MLSLSSFLPMSLSLLALAGSIWCYVHVRKVLRGASTRSLSQLSSEVAELTSASESLHAQVRRLAARVGMREVRQRREEQLDSSSQGGEIGEQIIPRAKLKELARARGHKITT